MSATISQPNSTGPSAPCTSRVTSVPPAALVRRYVTETRLSCGASRHEDRVLQRAGRADGAEERLDARRDRDERRDLAALVAAHDEALAAAVGRARARRVDVPALAAGERHEAVAPRRLPPAREVDRDDRDGQSHVLAEPDRVAHRDHADRLDVGRRVQRAVDRVRPAERLRRFDGVVAAAEEERDEEGGERRAEGRRHD